MDVMELRRGLLMGMAGGNLPSFMSKLDGGQITLEHDVSNDTLQINHNLGKTPDVIVIYRLTGDITAASTEAGIIACIYVYNPTGSTDAWIANSITYASGNGTAASVSLQRNVSAGIRNITDAKFDIYASALRPLLTGENYYWLAWTNK